MKWFIHAGPFRFSILNLLSFFVVLVFILAWFSRLGDNDLERFFNTDSLYLPSVYKDLFTDGHALKGWVFNPAPNFFPDMLLYFLLMPICGNSFLAASFVFSVIQVSALLYVMSRLFKSIIPGHSQHWHSLIFLLLTFFIMEYLFFAREYYYSFYILSNAFHTGSFVMGMLCLWMSIRYFTKPSAWLLVFLFIIGALCVISDRLFLLFYTIPVFSTTLFFVRRFKRKQVLFFSSALLLSAALGLVSLHLLSQGDYFYIDKPHKLMAFGDMQESFRIYTEQIGGYLSEFGFKSLTIYLSIAAFTGMIFLFFSARKSGYWLLCYYIVFSTVFGILVIGSPIINGNYTGYDTLRYNIYPFYLMPLNLAILLAYTLKHKAVLRYGKQFGLAMYLLFFINACTLVNGDFLHMYFSYYPDKARLLDTIKERLNFKCGVAGYWDTKPMTMFSKKEVKLYAAFPDLNYQSHVANTQWYSKNTFNYLLMPDPADTALYRQKLRSVRVLKTGLGFSIIITPDFTFPDSGISPVLRDSLKAN